MNVFIELKISQLMLTLNIRNSYGGFTLLFGNLFEEAITMKILSNRSKDMAPIDHCVSEQVSKGIYSFSNGKKLLVLELSSNQFSKHVLVIIHGQK